MDSKLFCTGPSMLCCQATALPARLFPFLWTTTMFCSPKNTRISQTNPICKILPTSRSQVSGNGILKKINNSRAMQHFLTLCNQSKKIGQAQDRAFGTTTALRTAEEWELWKVWSHQRRCASPTALWSHQWCGCPLSLISTQECRCAGFGSCQIHLVRQVCQRMACRFPHTLRSKISWYGLTTIGRGWGWCWRWFSCVNESVPDKLVHRSLSSPGQLCWCERYVSPFLGRWLWRYHRLIFQGQRHRGAKLRSTLL